MRLSEKAKYQRIIQDLHWMARRYADGRSTYAPGLLNEHTRDLLKYGFTLNPTADETIWARSPLGRGHDGLSDLEAAQGMEARRGETAGLDAKRDSPTSQREDAPNDIFREISQTGSGV